MSRKMRKGQTELTVVQHIILANFWEYYVTDEDTGDPDVKTCLVLGFENEIGDVYIPEIEPFIRSRTPVLKSVMPAPGWEWV